MRKVWAAMLACGLAGAAGAQSSSCGVMFPTMDYAGTHYGPFDYNNGEHRRGNLPVVERFHFTPKVQSLRGGNTSSTAGGDLSYTLKSFPNHHRALEVLIALSLKEKRDKPEGMEYPVDCWFDRAARWRPEDAHVPMIYGNYLYRTGRFDEALVQYQRAEKLGLEDPNLDYAMGLTYLHLKRPDAALTYAHKAYGAGYPLPALKEQLKRGGNWRDPQVAAPAAASAPE